MEGRSFYDKTGSFSCSHLFNADMVFVIFAEAFWSFVCSQKGPVKDGLPIYHLECFLGIGPLFFKKCGQRVRKRYKVMCCTARYFENFSPNNGKNGPKIEFFEVLEKFCH